MGIPVLKIYDENHNPIPIPAIKGEKGDPGERGQKGDSGGITVKGYYASASALAAAVPSPAAGDTYGVGTSAPYSIYIWDAVNSRWVDNGNLQGAKGDKGDKGDQGETGDTGAQGPQGVQGIQGPQGQQGEKGDHGDSGVYVGSGTIPEGYNVKINPGGDAAEFVEEAPNDGKQYARKNKAWAEVTGGGGSSGAEDISYDNTGSGLTADNVQDALDELAEGGGGSSTPAEYVTLEQYGGGTNKTASANDAAFRQAVSSGKNICVGAGTYLFSGTMIDCASSYGRISIFGSGNSMLAGLCFRFNIKPDSSGPVGTSGLSNIPTIRFSDLMFVVGTSPVIITAAPVDFINCTFSCAQVGDDNCIVGFAPVYVDTCLFSRCVMYEIKSVIGTYLYNGTKVTGTSDLVHGDWFRFEDVAFTLNTKVMELADNLMTKCSFNNCLHGYVKVHTGINGLPLISVNNHHTESLTHKLIEFDANPIQFAGHFSIANSYLHSTATPDEPCVEFDNCIINFGYHQNYTVLNKLNGSVSRQNVIGEVYYDPVSMAAKSEFAAAPFMPSASAEYYSGSSNSGNLQKYANGQTAVYAVVASQKKDSLYYRGAAPTVIWSNSVTCAANRVPLMSLYPRTGTDYENVYMHIYKTVSGTTYRCVVPLTKFRPIHAQPYAFSFADEPEGVYGYPWEEYAGTAAYESN